MCGRRGRGRRARRCVVRAWARGSVLRCLPLAKGGQSLLSQPILGSLGRASPLGLRLLSLLLTQQLSRHCIGLSLQTGLRFEIHVQALEAPKRRIALRCSDVLSTFSDIPYQLVYAHAGGVTDVFGLD